MCERVSPPGIVVGEGLYQPSIRFVIDPQGQDLTALEADVGSLLEPTFRVKFDDVLARVWKWLVADSPPICWLSPLLRL